MRIIEIITIKKEQFLQLFNRQKAGQRRPQSLFNYNEKAYENIWKSALYVLRDRHILSSSNKVDHLEKTIFFEETWLGVSLTKYAYSLI